MDVIFDLIGSFIIRGAIVLISLNLMIMMNDSLYRSSEQSYLNDMIAVPAEVITYDLRSAGYNASKNFLIAQKSEIKFCADTGNGNNIPDTVHFYLGSTDPVTHHKVLYRVINRSGQLAIARQVDTLLFTYFDSLGSIITPYGTNKSNVKSIFVQLRLESENVITTILSGSTDSLRLKAFWEYHIFPKNL